MSFELFAAGAVGGAVVYYLTKSRKSPEERLAELNAKDIALKLKKGGFLDRRDFIEKARAEIRRAPPGACSAWLRRWKIMCVRVEVLQESDAIPARAAEEMLYAPERYGTSDKWAMYWWHCPDTLDGLDILLGRFSDEYALNDVNRGGGLDVRDFIDMALLTIENLFNDVKAWLIREEGMTEDDLTVILQDVKWKVRATLKTEYPDMFSNAV